MPVPGVGFRLFRSGVRKGEGVPALLFRRAKGTGIPAVLLQCAEGTGVPVMDAAAE